MDFAVRETCSLFRKNTISLIETILWMLIELKNEIKFYADSQAE